MRLTKLIDSLESDISLLLS